jgi:hypothetical protein
VQILVKKPQILHVLLVICWEKNRNLRGGSSGKILVSKKFFCSLANIFGKNVEKWEKYGTVVILDRM